MKSNKLKAKMRASWRTMIVALIRVTSRVQANLEMHLRKLPPR